ncbi:hypothetical protein GCM10025868_41090 [Angustibacter aerolatus]|uniref:Uncharacterized protein n=1 Tax=Angustibacter aerolatus TaxID=1162965 RepID=A0ABQ6JLT7_9ACTN|nr:hypothetical protein GCM10025868_41090 [Angustibacter aerolatus]
MSLAGGGSAGAGDDRVTVVQPTAAGRAAAYLCFALCAAAVLFGIWLIVPQFH